MEVIWDNYGIIMINYEYPLACTLQEVILWVRYSHFWIPSGGYDCGLNLLAVRSEGILYRSWPRNMWITDRIPNFETYGLENQKKPNQSQPCDFMPSYEFQESNLHLKLLKSFMVVPFSHSPFVFFSFFFQFSEVQTPAKDPPKALIMLRTLSEHLDSPEAPGGPDHQALDGSMFGFLSTGERTWP